MTSGDEYFNQTAGLDGGKPSQRLYSSDLLLWQAAEAEALLPAGTTPLFFEGVTGVLFRSTTVPTLYADFDALHLPGLRAFGMEVKLEALSEDNDKLRALLKSSARGQEVFYRFDGEPFVEDEEDIEPDRQA